MSNYTMSFKSLRAGTVYTVNIYGSSGSAALIPAAEPFTTEEDNSEEVFSPIRTQSGYIRIVDDGTINWLDLMPFTDVARPVTLTAGNTVLWQGFMQSQNFSGTLYGNPQEREFAVQCPLASAGTQDIMLQTALVTGLKNFAYYLKLIIDYIASVGAGQVYYENVYVQGGEYGRRSLLLNVDPQAFQTLDLDKNEVNVKYSKYNVLEDICSYWGFSARTYRRDLYLMMPNAADSSFYRLTCSGNSNDLEAMAAGTLAGTLDSVNAVTIGNVFASINNDITVQRGYSKATVKCDAGTSQTEALSCFPEYIENLIDAAPDPQPAMEESGDNKVRFDGHLDSFTSIDLVGNPNVINTGGSGFRRGWIYQGALDTNNAKSDIIYMAGSLASDNPKIILTTNYEHDYHGMLFSFSGVAYSKGARLETSTIGDWGQEVMIVSLGIGTDNAAKWYNGSSWGTTEQKFAVSIGNKGNDMYVVTENEFQRQEYNKYITVPRNVPYIGKLFLKLYGRLDILENPSFFLTDFHLNMEYVSAIKDLPAKHKSSEIEVTAKNSNIVQDPWNADCIFCPYGKVKFGYGILSNPVDDSYGHNLQPQKLADRVASSSQPVGYWSTSKLMYMTELLANDSVVANLSPKDEATIGGTPCWPVSIGRNWRDDVANITFIQKP